MLKIFLFCTLVFALLPLCMQAAIVTATCDGVAGIPVDDSVSCSSPRSLSGNYSSASAGPFGVSAFSSSGPYPDIHSASASSSSYLRIEFTGGTGAGFYVPCLGSGGSRYADEAVRFGSVFQDGRYPANGTCGGDNYLNSYNQISFVFGVPQIRYLSMSAFAGPFDIGSSSGGAAGVSTGDSSSSNPMFVVLDATGSTRITNVTWTVEDVTSAIPEPSTAACFTGGLVVILLLSRLPRLKAGSFGYNFRPGK